MEKKCQVSFGTLALVICVGLQVLFIVEFGDHKAEIYSAYLQNIAMSIPNPLTVQPPPGAALQLHDSVDLNKIAA